MIIADTGFWVGLFDYKNSNHLSCKRFLSNCREGLITTTPVLTETIHLLNQRQHQKIALNFLTLLVQLRETQYFSLYEIEGNQLAHLLELMRQYSDLPMDYADASLVLLAEHLGHGRIVSTDNRDFRTYRWKNRQPFENLLQQH